MAEYNPDYHSSVVDNFRRGYKERYSVELTMPDMKVWKVFDDWYGVESEDSNDPELPIFEALKNVQQQHDDDQQKDE